MRQFAAQGRRRLYHWLQRGTDHRRVLCTLDIEAAAIHVEGGTEAWVPLTVTEPHYGGVRYWGRCPDCDVRVALLFVDNNDDDGLLCRRCVGVEYASARGSEAERAASQLAKARSVFVGPLLFGIPPDRPTAMSAARYSKHLVRLRACEQRLREAVIGRTSG
ncbi:MAG: hypothetical protein AB8H86_31130 [Polyangiales bacterium]